FASIILILCAAWALLPKVRAGCGKSARPDPRRGSSATVIPTPTLPSLGLVGTTKSTQVEGADIVMKSFDGSSDFRFAGYRDFKRSACGRLCATINVSYATFSKLLSTNGGDRCPGAQCRPAQGAWSLRLSHGAAPDHYRAGLHRHSG